MITKINMTIVTIMVAATLLVGVAMAATIDPTARTVTTGAFFVDWHDTNPEEIIDIRWMGSSNLTNTWAHPLCPDDLEYFGNSWVSQAEGTPDFVFASLVGWGTTGTWQNPQAKNIRIASSSAGCPGSAQVPVKTEYRFFDSGPAANKIRVKRTFSFGSTPFPYNLRPYIPRLYPRDVFTEVIHPDAHGTSLVTELAENCEVGCRVEDWDGSWFAMHDPAGGQGLMVRRDPSPVSVALWVDVDGGSFTNASSVLLLQPSGGFSGRVVEVEYMCFYDSSTWVPSIILPPGC